MRFDFDSETRRRLGYRLIDQIDSFFSSLPDRAVQLPLEQRTYGPLHDALPEHGEDAEECWTNSAARWWRKASTFPAPTISG